MLPISVVIITFNEDKNIEKALESVKWCNEIIVLDSGSTDKTIEICKDFVNCKIYTQQFMGYGEQKQKAISLATNDWILSIDADETITVELQNEIIGLSDIKDIKGFYIPRTLVFMNKVFKYGRENKMPQLRLFNKNYGNSNSNKVHEKIELSGKTGKLKGQILHYSFEDLYHYFEKFNEYTTQLALKMKENKRNINKISVILRLPFDFIKLYFVYGNCFNGYPGFVWSCLSVFYRFVKLNKYIEMNKF